MALLLGALPASAEHYLVYLIGGQSNANGRGDAAQLKEPLASPQKDVRFYWHRTQPTKNVGHLVEDQWIDLAPGSGHGRTEPVYPKEFGPELSFGRAMADARPDARVALIKYSVGGSNLHRQWADQGPLYRNFVNTVKAALKALDANGDTYEMRGMIWQQGEADAGGGEAVTSAYEKNLSDLISRVRKDLFGGKPRPFVIGGLSDSQSEDAKVEGSGWRRVRSAQEAVARTLPKVGFVNTDGFSTRIGEPIHFDHAAQIALGKGHAGEMLRLEGEGN